MILNLTEDKKKGDSRHGMDPLSISREPLLEGIYDALMGAILMINSLSSHSNNNMSFN